jgi:hypothetical protein
VVARDPIIEELHKIREAYAERFGNDLHAIVADALQRQGSDGRPVVRLAPRPVIKTQVCDVTAVATARARSCVTKLIREGQYAAEVEVDLIQNDGSWGPYLSAADASKLDEVRVALKRGDINGAAKFARIYSLTPVAG